MATIYSAKYFLQLKETLRLVIKIITQSFENSCINLPISRIIIKLRSTSQLQQHETRGTTEIPAVYFLSGELFKFRETSVEHSSSGYSERNDGVVQ